MYVYIHIYTIIMYMYLYIYIFIPGDKMGISCEYAGPFLAVVSKDRGYPPVHGRLKTGKSRLPGITRPSKEMMFL